MQFAVPGMHMVDWTIPDPNAQPIERVREIRDFLRSKVEDLAVERGWKLQAGK